MSEVGQLSRAAGLIGSLTILSRVTGLARDMLIGYLIGARGEADAFFVAFRIPNLLRRLTAEGALSAGFVPVLTDTLANEGEREAIAAARVIFTFATMALVALTACGIVLAGGLTRLFAPGFTVDPDKFVLTLSLVRLMFPYLFLVSLVALAMGYLHCFRHFMAPALSPVLLNLGIIVCAAVLTPLLSEPVKSLAYGVLVGGLAQLVLQIPYLWRHGFSWRPSFDFAHPALRRFLRLMGPAVIGAAVYQINVLVSTVLASMLPDGSVSYLYYADRMLQFPLGVFAVALGTAALPTFSSLAAKGDLTGLRTTLNYGLRLVNLVSLPASLGLMVIGVPVFSLLFERGAFDAADVVACSRALFFLAFGLWGISGSRLVVPVFYALHDTKTPVRLALYAFVLNFVLSLMFMGPVAVDVTAGFLARAVSNLSQFLGIFSLSYAGLALANSCSATFQFLALVLLVQRRIGAFAWQEFFSSFSRNLLSALLMALPLLLVFGRWSWFELSAPFWLRGVVLVGLIATAPLLYALSCRIVRSPDWPLCESLRGRFIAAVLKRGVKA